MADLQAIEQRMERPLRALGFVGRHLNDLAVLGPVDARKWDLPPETFPHKLSVEEWSLPDGTHFVELSYRALAHPWFDAEQWAQLPAAFRRLTLARTLRDIVSDASDAGVAGGFDPPEAQIRRVSVNLDQEGWSDVARLLNQTLTALQQIHTDSNVRAGERELGRPIVDAEIALLLFRRST